jgi:hypothetical protein
VPVRATSPETVDGNRTGTSVKIARPKERDVWVRLDTILKIRHRKRDHTIWNTLVRRDDKFVVTSEISESGIAVGENEVRIRTLSEFQKTKPTRFRNDLKKNVISIGPISVKITLENHQVARLSHAKNTREATVRQNCT